MGTFEEVTAGHAAAKLNRVGIALAKRVKALEERLEQQSGELDMLKQSYAALQEAVAAGDGAGDALVFAVEDKRAANGLALNDYPFPVSIQLVDDFRVVIPREFNDKRVTVRVFTSEPVIVVDSDDAPVESGASALQPGSAISLLYFNDRWNIIG